MNVRDKGDIVVVRGPASDYQRKEPDSDVYHKVKFHQIVSIIECKPWKENGSGQSASYSFQLLEARPDMPGVYGLALRPRGYIILWSDASGIIGSDEYPWDNLIPLASYVYSLYVPPPDHHLWDPSITVAPDPPFEGKAPASVSSSKLKGTTDMPLWMVHGLRTEPLLFQRFAAGNPWGRRSDVFQHIDSDGNIYMVKDAYHASGRFNEHDVLDKIHEHGIFPGVVRILPCKVPEIKTAQPVTGPYDEESIRTKTRVFMGSFGEAFEKALTVLDVLKATYDVNEGA